MLNERVIYEPHPVSPERKAELRAQGFKIIDASFGPRVDLRSEAGMTPEAEARELVTAELWEKGVEFDPDAPLHELYALNITPQDASGAGGEPEQETPAKRGRKAKE